MTTWHDLERHRRQSDPTIPVVSWRCQHHPPVLLVVRNVLPKHGKCADCRTPIAIDSRRCQRCAHIASGRSRSL